MPTVVNRGMVHLTIPDPVTKQVTTVKASTTQTLISTILTFINERDSDKTLEANINTSTKISQLNGIKDPVAKSDLESSAFKTVPGSYVFASDINNMIKYVNDLTATCGSRTSSYQTVECSYPQPNVEIRQVVQETSVPDRQLVDPITGVPILDDAGKPVMVAGLKNPVPVLDNDGKPTYYTVSGDQIFTEGPITNIDVVQTITLCTNTSISCPNRTKLTGWVRTDSADPTAIVNVCTNTRRSQIVYNGGTTIANPIPTVNPGEFVKADTFNLIIANLIAVNNSLDSYKDWWDGHCSGACQLTCQVTCQTSCQLACQNCYGGTCHNQNCGGFS